MKKMILVLGAMFLMLSLADVSVLAEEKQIVKADDPCDGSTAVELRICAEKQLKAADSKLNESYQKLKTKIDTFYDKEKNKKIQTLLIKTQSAWIEFRDAECELSGHIERYGATPNWMLVSTVFCKVRMTQERALELESERYLEKLIGK